MSVVVIRPNGGFTLIELVVTVAILAIAALVAVPAFNNLIQGQRAASHANLLMSSISLARSEAIRLNSPVRVSALSVGAGWCVHITETCDNDSRLQEVGLPFMVEVNGWQNMTFDGRGRRSAPATGNLSIVVQSRECRGERAREVRIAPIGQTTSWRSLCVS